ncbi:hypothetical protein BDV93DRAFT_220838 [Ceratobasidium sp. AG-I]|nr:hypothetical protein BDV93DRAFT_220838 [Ceratobasidium sp. AG-I]
MAADCRFELFSSHHQWKGATLPPFTLCAGDLGLVVRPSDPVHVVENGTAGCVFIIDKDEDAWKVLEACGDPGAERYLHFVCSEHVKRVSGGVHIRENHARKACVVGVCKWKSLPRTHPQYWTWVTDCPHQSVKGPGERPTTGIGWEDVMKRAQMVSKQQKFELDQMLYVVSTLSYIWIQRNNLLKQSPPEALFYFHRNPLARLSPREFWGFFSTSPDPFAPSTGLEDLDCTFRYSIGYNTVCIGDDWGRQYQRALRAGLAAIPGGYPGAHIEELSDDEAE